MKTFLASTGSICFVAGLCLSLSSRLAVAGSALSFDGGNDYVNIGTGLFPTVTNTFTIELWVNPTASRASTPEAITGFPGVSGQRYAVFPDPGYGSAVEAGAGISVGINGVSVFEHSTGYLPSPLVYSSGLTGWNHIAVVYSNGLPRLYVGGNLVRTGLVSGRLVHPGANLGEAGFGFGYFQGMLDEVRIWNVALSAATLQNWLDREVDASHPAFGSLIGYWRLNEGAGLNSADASGLGHNASLLNGTVWATPGAPLNGLQQPIVFTEPASEVEDTSARLTGTVNPRGNATVAWFEWGPTTSYGFATPGQAVGDAAAPLEVSSAITGLAPLSNYSFRLVASNALGVSRSVSRELRTGGPPEANTLAASNLGATNATLQGAITPNGHATWAWFDWGPTTNYGNATPPQSAGGGLDSLVVTHPLVGLLVGHEYHFRIVATNASGATLGRDQWFATQWLTNAFALQSLARGGVNWGDFDGSGRLDLLALVESGVTSAPPVLWLNKINSFTPSNPGLPVLPSSVAVVGDLDNDGSLDVVMGQQGSIKVFLNDRSGNFPTSWSQPPYYGPGLDSGALGDFDNDGDLDLLETGSYWNGSGYSPWTRLYRNDDGRFSTNATQFPQVLNGAVAWGDYDNDGQLDILIAGDTGTQRITRIYHNDNGVFTDISAGLVGAASGAVAWGDYDGDGWLDVLVVGTTNRSPDGTAGWIYRNLHNGAFTNIGANLPGVYNGTAAWGDFNNDSQLDVLLIGVLQGDGSGAVLVYRNDRGQFTDADAGLPAYAAAGWRIAAGGWGDYDSDGRLDVALSTGYWPVIYRNCWATTNTSPNAPSPPPGLVAEVQNNGVTLHWNAAADPHTPAPGLTYNLRVGTTPGGQQVLASSSDPLTGQRYLPQRGNADHRLFATLTNLPVGLNHWSVQAVNHTFAGSPWAMEQTFAVTSGPPVAITRPASNVLCCSALLNGFVTPNGLPTSAWFEWGTSTNFGNTTSSFELGTRLEPLLVQQTLPGLQPRITYFLRLVATNNAGLALGSNQSFTTEGPAPLVSTLAASNVSYTSSTPFGVSPLSSPTADYFIEWGITMAYGHLTPGVISDAALQFDGVDDRVATAWGTFANVTNNFTLELWAKPTAARIVTTESVSGQEGLGGQRYAIFPEGGVYGGASHVGAGLSVGTNGVSVMEHGQSYLPSVLVYSNGLDGWRHLALVYSNHIPKLFVNATLVRTGLVSSRIVHPSAGLGGMAPPWTQFGHFAGELQDVRIWDVPLDAPTIQAWMNQTVTSNHPAYSHLQGYWPLNEGRGSTAADVSPRNNTGQLLKGAGWTGGRNSSARVFSALLAGLAPGTSYHFRAVAINPGGTAYGADQVFTTLPLPHVLGVTVQTVPATPGSLLDFSGVAEAAYVLEASTNLVNWLALTNLIADADGFFDFLDTGATNIPTRFYRLRVP